MAYKNWKIVGKDKLPPEGRYLVFVQRPAQMRPIIEIAKRYIHKPAVKRDEMDDNFLITGTVLQWTYLPDEPKNE